MYTSSLDATPKTGMPPPHITLTFDLWPQTFPAMPTHVRVNICRDVYPLNSHDATLLPQLPHLRSPTFSSPPLPSPFTGVRGYDPPKFFRITDAHRRVLEHFEHKNHFYEPGFLTGSCKFRISSKCACSIVNRWSFVCDHLTEIPSFCWVIAAS